MILSLILLLIPFAIVGAWTKRPVIAMIVAIILAAILLTIPSLIPLFQTMMIYGTVDPLFFAESLSFAMARAIMVMFIIVPLLFIFQIFMRRRRKKINKSS